MKLLINGEYRDVVDNISLQELITKLELTPERIAIELNQHVVRRVDWPSTVLREKDRVEIVHFVGGGEGEEAGGRCRSQVRTECNAPSCYLSNSRPVCEIHLITRPSQDFW